MEYVKEFLNNILKYLTIERALFISAIILYYIKKRYGKRISNYVKNTNNVIDDTVWDAVCVAEVTLNGKPGLLKFGGAKAMAIKAIIDSGLELPKDNELNDLIEKNHKKMESKLNEIKGDVDNGEIEEYIENNVEYYKENINNSIQSNKMDNSKFNNQANKMDNTKEQTAISENIQKEQIKSNEKIEINKSDNELLKDILKINEGVTATQMWANVAVTNKGFKAENTNVGATVGIKWFPK